MRIGGSCQSQIGQSKKYSPLRTSTRIEMLIRYFQLCSTISFFHFSQFDAYIISKTVVLEKFLWCHLGNF